MERQLAWTVLRRARDHSRSITQKSDPALTLKKLLQMRGISRARSQLIGVDDGKRVERKRLQRKPYAIESKIVETPPSHGARRGMHNGSVAIKRKASLQQTRGRAAVVEQNHGSRIEKVKIAHQVNYALRVFVH